MDSELDAYFDLAVKITKTGGQLIRDRIWKTKSVKTKASESDLVTETDHEIEALFIDDITKAYPNHKFIGEETTASGKEVTLTDDPTWIIDPVDGTLNFVHGYPNACISVALVVNKTLEIGIIYNPVCEMLFTARKGRGAFLNGAPIKVSKTKELSRSLITIEFGTKKSKEESDIVMQNINILRPLTQGIRCIGSAALNMAMVALGGSDAYFEYGIHAWDYAAGTLLIQEAGGVVIDPAGGPIDLFSCRMLCASTPTLAQEISKLIKQHYPTRDL
nr:PREDICTED: inositol monophosphatase 1 [Bemisia tabaci]